MRAQPSMPAEHPPVSRCPELIMPLHQRDIGTALRTLAELQSQVQPQRISIIAAASVRSDPRLTDHRVIDEDTIVPGMTFQSIEQELERRGLRGIRSPGWLLQQFLKLGYARHAGPDGFVVWDSDTLPLRPVSFFDAVSGKPFFLGKTEHFPAYFELNKRLLGLEYRSELPSFVAEVMYLRTDLATAMLDEIETATGLPFWQGIISVMDADSIPAEFELFGNFVAQRHPGDYVIKDARSFRFAAKLVGTDPTPDQLAWLAKDFDIISLESYHERWLFSRMTRVPLVRRLVSPRRFCMAFNAVAAPLVKTTWTRSRYFYF